MSNSGKISIYLFCWGTQAKGGKGGMFNKSGQARRKPSDNRVRKAGVPVMYEGRRISYNAVSEYWLLDGEMVGSLSNLSKALKLNNETHEIGFFLEERGYVFAALFR